MMTIRQEPVEGPERASELFDIGMIAIAPALGGIMSGFYGDVICC